MKYLILGDGKLATELHKQTGWDYISRKKDGIDFTIPSTYDKHILEYDVIINCIANTNTQDNTKNANWYVNYLGVISLVDICNIYNKKLVHMSTDYLYSGSNSNASEEDVPVHVNNWYCYTKLLADGYVQAMAGNYLMIRTSFKLKPYPWPEAWYDIATNADYIDIISHYIIKLIECDASGIYNVGTEIKSFYQLAMQTRSDVRSSFDDDDDNYHRPHDVTMNLTKMKNKLKI